MSLWCSWEIYVTWETKRSLSLLYYQSNSIIPTSYVSKTLHFARCICFLLFLVVVRSSRHNQNGAVRIACKINCSISCWRFCVTSNWWWTLLTSVICILTVIPRSIIAQLSLAPCKIFGVCFCCDHLKISTRWACRASIRWVTTGSVH